MTPGLQWQESACGVLDPLVRLVPYGREHYRES